MTTPETKTDIKNKYAIYFIGLATIAESIILIMIFNMILNQAYSARASYNSTYGNPPEYFSRAASIATLGLIMYGIRLFFGVFLIIGHMFKSLKIILVFLVFMAVGIAINIGLGVMAQVNQMTSTYARVCYGVIAFHILYIWIAWHVLKVEFQKRVNAANREGPIGYVPHGAPVQTTVNVGSNAQSNVSFNSNRVEPVQLYPVGFDDEIQNETTGYSYPPPPKYSEIDQFAGYNAKQNSHKPAN